LPLPFASAKSPRFHFMLNAKYVGNYKT
jgi:hypothetical protein